MILKRLIYLTALFSAINSKATPLGTPLASASIQEPWKILKIVEITSTGPSGPLNIVKNRPWIKNDSNPQFLTEVGKRQGYNNGLNTNARFPSIFQNWMKRGNLTLTHYTRARGTRRAIQYAISHSLGLFSNFHDAKIGLDKGSEKLRPPGKQGGFLNSSGVNFTTALPFGYNPVIVDSQRPLGDFLLDLAAICKPIQNQTRDRYNGLDQLLSQDSNIKSLLQSVMTAYNLPESWEPQKSIFSKLTILADFALQDYYSSLNPVLDPSKSTQNQQIFDQLKRVDTVYRSYNWTTDRSKLQITGLLEAIINNFSNKIKGKSVEKILPFYTHYSAEDNILIPFLALIQQTNSSCSISALQSNTTANETKCPFSPPPASNLIFELIAKPSAPQQPFVKVSYNGEYVDFCGNEKIDPNTKNEFICSFEEFLAVSLKWYLQGARLKECGFFVLRSIPWGFYLLLAVSLLSLMFIMFLFTQIRTTRSGLQKKFDESKVRLLS